MAADHSRSCKLREFIQFVDVEHHAIEGRHLIENPKYCGSGPLAPVGNPIASGNPEIFRLEPTRGIFNEK